MAPGAFALTEQERAQLRQFKVLNSDGKEAPPPNGERIQGGWPYGVLVVFENGKMKGVGSVSHFGDGRLLTAGHNVSHDPNPAHYGIVYYDKQGTKQISGLSSIPFVKDDHVLHDFAVLQTAPGVGEKWHAVQGAVARSDPEEFHRLPAAPRSLDIWVMDPLFTRMDVARKAGLTNVRQETGAVLTRRTAIGSRTKPALSATENLARQNAPPAAGTPPVYLDSFGPDPKQTTRGGNSGALITSTDSRGRIEVVGVVSAGNSLPTGMYFGNSGTEDRGRYGIAFSEGAALDHLLEAQLGFGSLSLDCPTAIRQLATRSSH